MPAVVSLGPTLGVRVAHLMTPTYFCNDYPPLVKPNDYSLYAGFIHLGAGLACGFTGLAAGYAIGFVGDSVRTTRLCCHRR